MEEDITINSLDILTIFSCKFQVWVRLCTIIANAVIIIVGALVVIFNETLNIRTAIVKIEFKKARLMNDVILTFAFKNLVI